MAKQLKQSRIFMGLNEVEINKLMSTTHHNILHFRDGDMIAQAGDHVTSIMIILEGNVRTEILNKSGKTLRIEDLTCSNILAPGFIFGTQNTYPVNVISNTDTEILVIQKNSFVDLLSKNSTILINFLDIISNKTQFLATKIKNTFMLSIEEKIAKYFLSIAETKRNMEFELPNSQIWMAEKFGVTRPSVARVISKMNDKKIIKSMGRKIKILDKEKLKDCATRE